MGEYKEKIIKIIPSSCTLINAMCGIMALLISVFHKTHIAIDVACFLILLGGFFDSIDGRLARKLKVESEIGKQLDSFADNITFGITPMCVFLALHSIGQDNRVSLPEIMIATFYIACTVYRLARYNVSEHMDYFMGLPSTAAGMIMSLYIFISKLTIHHWSGEVLYTYLSYGFIILLGLAMISTIKVKRI